MERYLAEWRICQIHGVHFSRGHLPWPQSGMCLIWKSTSLINRGRLILRLGESTDDPVVCTILQEEYLLHTCFAAVGYDSLNSSRPISSPAENPTQIKEMFDTVSYDKVCFQRHTCVVPSVTKWATQLTVTIHYEYIMCGNALPAKS